MSNILENPDNKLSTNQDSKIILNSSSLISLSDDELMSKIRMGHHKAFLILQQRWAPRLYSFVFRYVHQREETEDLVQETFYRVFKNREKYKPVASFSTWIHTIALNLIRSRHRKVVPQLVNLSIIEEQIHEPLTTFADSRPLQHELLEMEESSQLLNKALISLSEEYRTAIVLRDFLHLTYEEMAMRLNLPEGTVKSRINRARKHFREFVEKSMHQ